MCRPQGAEGEICRCSAVAYGAMHPKGTCSASLHCVGIAPYARLPHLHLALALSFRASAHTGVGIRTPRPQARNPPTSLCEAAQCSHWVVRSEAKLRCHGEAVTVGEICHGSSAAYGAMHPKGTCFAAWASPPYVPSAESVCISHQADRAVRPYNRFPSGKCIIKTKPAAKGRHLPLPLRGKGAI